MLNSELVADRWQRPLRVLRLSLTARCNLACSYCQPDHREVSGLLNQSQRLALIAACCRLGVRSLRLTGGEPLLSDQLEPLLEAIQSRRQQPDDPLAQLDEVALTSNGLLLDRGRAEHLRRVGLDRITLSLDGLDAGVVADMAGLPAGVEAGARALAAVREAIVVARQAGFEPRLGALKLNSVIQRGRNEDQLLPLAAFAREQGLELRFIESMDVGHRNGWSGDQVMPAVEMLRELQAVWPLEPLGRPVGGTARRWRYRDGAGVVSVIASVSEPFCTECNRARITADGQLFTCLFASTGLNLRPWLEPGSDPEVLCAVLRQHWRARTDRYSEERGLKSGLVPERAEMAYLGG